MNTKRADIILMSLLIMIGMGIGFFVYLPRQSTADYVEIQVDGTITATYPLTENRTETIKTNADFINTFTIKNGSVTMMHANCPDKVCLHTPAISKNGESIVCLPHKVVISIHHQSEEAPEVDAISGRGGGTR